MKSCPGSRFAWLLLVSMIALENCLAGAEIAAPEKLDPLVKPLVDGGWVYGLAIGLINEQGTQVVGYGKISAENPAAPAGNTEFEIGSISKTFTGLLLAQMVEEHLVALDDPVQKLLGDSVVMPKTDTHEITLVDLATHCSALPRMPSNFAPKDPTNPFADYTPENLFEFLSKHKLRREPQARYEYSNLGMGLLGFALAQKTGVSYEELLRTRVCGPLGMEDTRITLDEARQARLAKGHDYEGNPEANWDIPTLAGAGAIRSTADDMLRYLAAQLALTKTPFDAAISASHTIHFKAGKTPFDLALAWHVRRSDHVIWHNGQTGGYHSFAAFSPEKRAGVVVLANSAALYLDELGSLLLQLVIDGQARPLKIPQPIKLSADALEPFVGRYRLNAFATATVTRDGDQLFVELTGQPKAKVHPESATRFFYRAVEAAVSFETGDDGAIKEMVIHQNGQDIPAAREKQAREK